jgi:class 3 adenylate cyclase
VTGEATSGTVTVLFTDVVGSTELMTGLGETAFDRLRRDHFARLRAAIAATGGTEVKNTGDGLMATFASAVGAVRAAVAMQQSTVGAGSPPVDIRVGLSLGETTFEDGDVFGAAVVEAARLAAVARPGQILATAVVRAVAGARAGDDLTWNDAGAMELKGLPAPVEVVEIGWALPVSRVVPLPALVARRGGWTFVGRGGEQERLLTAWKEAAAGERRVVLVGGEPGVGKTRLCSEVARTVHDEGAVVLAGRCDEDLGVPYQPFVEALRHHVGAVDGPPALGALAGELVRLVPEIAELITGLPPPLRSDPETERYRLFEAVAGWLRAASGPEAAPVLLVLDDLHWAAKPTLLLLRHIVRSPAAEGARLLVLGTYRDTELGRTHPLAELLADLRRDTGAERLALAGLDESGVAAFIEAAAGHAFDEDDLALSRAIHDETEGNPFFVGEVLRHLAESGALRQHDGRWVRSRAVAELGIPEGVREVVGRRLSRLSETANRALAAAAVIGPEFDLTVLRATADLDEDTLLAALEDAVAARLVAEVAGPGVHYRFAHAIVRATLYEEVSAARRAVLHGRVAAALEATHGQDLDDHLPALAHHFSRAGGDLAPAVTYATRAGDRALVLLAHDEAARYYRQALDLLDVTPDAEDGRRCDLLIALGEAQRRAAEPGHRETLLAAARLARAIGDARRLGEAAVANSRAPFPSTMMTVDAERIEALEAAAAALEGQETALRARVLTTLALEKVFTDDFDTRRRLSDEGLALARTVDDPRTLAQVLLSRYFTIVAPSTVGERLAETAELVALTARLGDPVLQALAALVRSRALVEPGEIDEAERCIATVERIAADVGQPTLRWMGLVYRWGFVALRGRLEEAGDLLARGFELGQASGQPDAAVFRAAHTFFLCFEQDRLAEMPEADLDVVRRLPNAPAVSAILALLEWERGERESARWHYESLAGARFETVFLNHMWFWTLALCVEVAWRVGDEDGAAVLVDLLAPWSSQIVGVGAGWMYSAAHSLALAETTRRRFDAAEARFAEAAAIHERIGAPRWLARTHREWDRMRHLRGTGSRQPM